MDTKTIREILCNASELPLNIDLINLLVIDRSEPEQSRNYKPNLNTKHGFYKVYSKMFDLAKLYEDV